MPPRRQQPVAPDTTALIALHKADLLDVLNLLFTRTLVTTAVEQELREGGPTGLFEPNPANYPWMEVVPVAVRPEVTARRLSPNSGEASVLSLALEQPGVFPLLDEIKARKIGDALNVDYSGTVWLVVTAKNIGRIPLVRPVLEKMMEGEFGLHLSDELLAWALSAAGED